MCKPPGIWLTEGGDDRRWYASVALCAVCIALIGYWWYREITYAAVLGVSVNVYLFSAHREARFLDIMHGNDNHLPKLMFWPAVIVFLTVVTAVTFW
jgi:hypothetical protein